MKKEIHIIVAMQESDKGIGFEGELLYCLPKDMEHFKELTSGHAVIMGRKTWESIPEKFRPLPNRTNIVVTRNKDFKINNESVLITNSFEEALEKAEGVPGEIIFIIGGSALYKEALPVADIIDLTLIHDENNTSGVSRPADTYFEGYLPTEWLIVNEVDLVDEKDSLTYSFLTQKRIDSPSK